MKTLPALLSVLAVASANVVQSKSENDSGNFELLILHNNDMHARFEQTSQLSGICTTADREAGKCYGGFPRVATVVKQARRDAASGIGPPVLYLNAGDTYTGTAWFTIYKWKIAAEFINALEPDAVALGMNDVENSNLSTIINHLNIPVLSSNVLLQEKGKLQKSVTFEINGNKVGVIGFLSTNINNLPSTSEFEFTDEILAMKEEVEKLTAAGVKVIIALGHADHYRNLEIARDVDGLDVVVSGNRNRFFWDGHTSDRSFENTVLVSQVSGRQVVVVASQAYDQYLGKLKLHFDTDGEIVTFNSELITLDQNIAQDTQITDIIEAQTNYITRNDDNVVGTTAVVLDGDTCNLEECNLGNLITDAIIYYYAIRFEGERWTDAPIAIINGGSIAASIAPANRPASVTTADIFKSLPLESYLVKINLTGVALRELLETAVADYDPSNPSDLFLQYSGIRVVYDFSQEPGSRVVNAVVRCWSCYVPEFYEINDSFTYVILAPAVLTDTTTGFSVLANSPKEELTYDEVTCLSEYIGLRSPVYPDINERIILRNVDDIKVAPQSPTESVDNATESVDNATDSSITIHCSLFVTVIFATITMYF